MRGSNTNEPATYVIQENLPAHSVRDYVTILESNIRDCSDLLDRIEDSVRGSQPECDGPEACYSEGILGDVQRLVDKSESLKNRLGNALDLLGRL